MRRSNVHHVQPVPIETRTGRDAAPRRLVWEMWLVAPLLIGLGLIAVSTALGLYDRIWHWGKVVHGVEGVCVTTVAALLLLGYRERAQPGLPIHIAALASVCIGITFGACWEFVEYLLDWLRYSDLQKSNTDTMSDLLWHDLGAIATTVLIFHVYHHTLSQRTRANLGQFADALVTPLGDFLNRHGKLAAALVLLGIAVYVAALWLAGRPVPGLPSG
jgi:hypothetical protein